MNYLNAGYGLKSWLLTLDHKRVAWLYFISITGFFFLGGAAATLVRLELITPAGDLLSSDAYNQMFSLHGIVMVWFFLIPSIPATMGNFLLPLMLGARDMAFPRLNLMSWYVFILGGAFTLTAVIAGDHMDWITTSPEAIRLTLSSKDFQKARNWPARLASMKIAMVLSISSRVMFPLSPYWISPIDSQTMAMSMIPMAEMSRIEALPLNSGFSSSDQLLIGRPIRSGRMPSVSAL